MGPTNKYEQEPVYNLPDKNGEALEPGQLGRIVLERIRLECTEVYQQNFDDLIGEFWD